MEVRVFLSERERDIESEREREKFRTLKAQSIAIERNGI